jgi:hypothetical protein
MLAVVKYPPVDFAFKTSWLELPHVDAKVNALLLRLPQSTTQPYHQDKEINHE